ncbi:hypothetical protein [Lignipirellula cremea]|uniref:Uncharacterized protein n=1 Tax=Lignipirellula cremea TaxID=2528010 RepID=A0A518E433_9BACT|nr:hypothetical protein [Lignipirellula cremea]QDU98855.1 hypothetical protein Pla8534_67660 [Lignipirellula cremea]
MKSFLPFPVILVCAVFLASPGCSSCSGWPFQDKCADIPPGAIPQTGAHVAGWQSAQAALAERDDLVVYQYEWIGETAELGPFGSRHVDELMHRCLNVEPGAIILEPSGVVSIDVARQSTLIARLASHGVPDAESRVLLGYSKAEGLYGQEALPLSAGYLRSGSRTGNGLGGGSFGGGGRGSQRGGTY